MRRGLPGVIGQPVRGHATEEVGSVFESVPFSQERMCVRVTDYKPEIATRTLAQVRIYCIY